MLNFINYGTQNSRQQEERNGFNIAFNQQMQWYVKVDKVSIYKKIM